MNLFTELKRRNVFRVGIAYAVAAWLLVQIADLALDVIGAEDWVLRSVVFLLALGFIPTVIFAWAFELTPEGIKREKDVNRDASITNVTAKKLDYVTIGLLIGAITVVGIDRFVPVGGRSAADESTDPRMALLQEDAAELDPNRAPSALPQETLPKQNQPPPKSVAVLPFVNMSEDANNEYFSDGISEEILNALAKVTDLKVAGRTSSFAFKGHNQDLREIGTALNVSHILEGSVRKAGNRVRVTAQLIKADDGYHVWSENYDRELDDIFAIQDEISAAILQQLKAHLMGEDIPTVARTDSEAYDLYLLASQRIYERNQPSLQMASDLLSKAIKIDPEYAPAFSQLGIATLLLSSENYGELLPEEAHSKAKDLFDRAMQLDPEQAEAMAGMGLWNMNSQLDYASAIQWLERALAINPNLTNASVWLASALSEQGELKRNIEILQQTFARDPLHPPTYNNIAQEMSVAGRFDEARALLTNLKKFLPSDSGLIASLGKVEAFAGNWAEADRKLTEAVELEPLNFVDRLWWSASALASRQYERVAESGTPNWKSVALDHLGRTEEALLIGEKWVNAGNTPEFQMTVLNRRGRFQETVEFVESRWPDLDSLERAFPNRSGLGAELLLTLAQAYSRVGNQQKFDDVMQRARDSLQQQVDQGARNWILENSRAMLAMLEGDQEGALSSLGSVVDMGGLPQTDYRGEFSVFAPLSGDPRFEAVMQRMQAKLDLERANLGLPPGSI